MQLQIYIVCRVRNVLKFCFPSDSNCRRSMSVGTPVNVRRCSSRPEVPNLCSAELGLRVHFPGAPRPLQENKINKN